MQKSHAFLYVEFGAYRADLHGKASLGDLHGKAYLEDLHGKAYLGDWLSLAWGLAVCNILCGLVSRTDLRTR